MKQSVTVPALLLSAGGAARALQMSVSVGKTNLLLRNLLRTPILELEASKLNLGEGALLSYCSGFVRLCKACLELSQQEEKEKVGCRLVGSFF